MEEEIQIINTQTRNEKIKNFFINNKKKFIYFVILVIIFLFSIFFYQDYKLSKKEEIANKYNFAALEYQNGEKTNTISTMEEIISFKDSTYSVLAFYFLLENDLIEDPKKINSYYDLIINDINLKDEIKELNIFKKALFNSDFVDENELLKILDPLIKSKSVWKSHGMYLMAEFYLFNNQKKKSEEFFKKIVDLEDANDKIKLEAQKRLRAEFSE